MMWLSRREMYSKARGALCELRKYLNPKCIVGSVQFDGHGAHDRRLQSLSWRRVYLVSLELALIIGGLALAEASRHPSAAQTASFRELHQVQLAGYVNSVAWNADGTKLAALSNYGSTITVLDAKDWNRRIEFHRVSGAYSGNSFAYLPNGALLTGAPVNVSPEANTLSLTLWDAATGKLLKEVPGPPKSPPNVNIVDTFSVSKDGAHIAAIPTHHRHHVIVFDSKNWQIIQTLDIPPTTTHPDFAVSLAMSPDGREVVVGTGFGYVRFFSVETGSLQRSIFAYPDGSACNAIAISPDGRFIAIGRGLGLNKATDHFTVSIWHFADGALVKFLPGTAQVVRSVAWDSVNSLFAIGDDTSLRLFRIDDNEQKLLFSKNFSRGVFSVAFSPTGDLAVAGGTEVVIFIAREKNEGGK